MPDSMQTTLPRDRSTQLHGYLREKSASASATDGTTLVAAARTGAGAVGKV